MSLPDFPKRQLLLGATVVGDLAGLPTGGAWYVPSNNGTEEEPSIAWHLLDDWTGSDAIDTVGTITTGTWEGESIDFAHGGTGLTAGAAHDLVVSDGTDLEYATLEGTTDEITISYGTGTITLGLASDLHATDLTLSGTLSVVDDTTLHDATIDGTLGVADLATLDSASITHNATVGGTLGVAGVTTLGAELIVNSTSGIVVNAGGTTHWGFRTDGAMQCDYFIIGSLGGNNVDITNGLVNCVSGGPNFWSITVDGSISVGGDVVVASGRNFWIGSAKGIDSITPRGIFTGGMYTGSGSLANDLFGTTHATGQPLGWNGSAVGYLETIQLTGNVHAAGYYGAGDVQGSSHTVLGMPFVSGLYTGNGSEALTTNGTITCGTLATGVLTVTQTGTFTGIVTAAGFKYGSAKTPGSLLTIDPSDGVTVIQSGAIVVGGTGYAAAVNGNLWVSGLVSGTGGNSPLQIGTAIKVNGSSGTQGQVLTANASGPPSWQTPGTQNVFLSDSGGVVTLKNLAGNTLATFSTTGMTVASLALG